MKTENYIPQPIDTSDVELPEELKPLVEEMAKNVHEVWAETRIKQGWTYGEQRNDELKTHPCLVPYEELPEEEKVYDRNTSIDTLKFILKEGFTISKWSFSSNFESVSDSYDKSPILSEAFLTFCKSAYCRILIG